MPSSRRSLKQVIWLALPIMAGMASQSLINLVDAIFVGQLGEIPLAAVGVGAYLNFVATALIIGISSSVQAMVARRRGQQREDLMAAPLGKGLVLAFAVGIALTLIFWQLAPTLVAMMLSDAESQAIAREYLQIRVLGISLVAANFAYRGYWNGRGRSMIYLRTLIAYHSLNVLLTWLLVFGHWGFPELGPAGAAWGTTLALLTGTLLYTAQTARPAVSQGLFRIGDGGSFRDVLRLAIPHSLQQFFFAMGIATLFWIIAQLGMREVAIAHVLVNLALFLILPAVGIGMASTTLVSQSLGEGNPEQARRFGWQVVGLALVLLACLALPMLLAPTAVLGLFLHNPDIIAMGTTPLRMTAIAVVLDAVGIVLAQALLGAGANRTVLKVSISLQWGLLLPLAWLLGPVLGGGLTTVWGVQLLFRCVNSAVFATIWQKGRWQSIRL